MFIKCSSCDSKYLVNSADLKPDGRMVECANCSHQWFQEPDFEEELLPTSAPSTNKNKKEIEAEYQDNKFKNKQNKHIRNLPSTIVKENKVSVTNSILVIVFLFLIILIFWLLKKYGINIFVLMNYYIDEFYFNLKLIISDIGKIIYQIIN